MNRQPFAEGEFYHVFNQGVEKRNIFSDDNDTRRFLQSMIEFNTVEPVGSLYELSFKNKKPLGGFTPKSGDKEKLVNIICYCLNPNHFHFVLEQVSERGISEFMKRLSGGYTVYFNGKHKRRGALFQGTFKAKHINSNEYLLHVSSYVNLNDRVHQLGGETSKLVRSSWDEYVKQRGSGFCTTGVILEQFPGGAAEYERFAKESLELTLSRRKEEKDFSDMLLENE